MTLWLLHHGRLPTADHLWRRTIIPSPLCSLCGEQSETALHALRDCPRVCRVWRLLLFDSDCIAFWRPSRVDEWVNLNLSVKMERLTGHLHWKYIFRQCVQDLWTNRNFMLYRNSVWPGYHFFVKRLLVRVLDTLASWLVEDGRLRPAPSV